MAPPNRSTGFTFQAVPDVPGNTGVVSGPEGSKAANPAAGSLSLDGVVRDRREVTLHIKSEPKGVDKHTPAIVMEQTPTRTLLLSASWGIETFLLEKDRRPVISYKVSGADSPVEYVAGDLNLGIAIFSVPTSVSNRLTPWPKDEISEVRVGNYITYQGTSHRARSFDKVFVRRVQEYEMAVNGVLVFDGRIDGDPGSVLLRNGKLAAMLLGSAELAAGGSVSYALPAQALFDRFHQLLEMNKHPNEKSGPTDNVIDGHPGAGQSSSSGPVDLLRESAPGARFESPFKSQAPLGILHDQVIPMSNDVNDPQFPITIRREDAIEADVAITDVQFATIPSGQSKRAFLIIRGKKPIKIDELYREKKESSKIQDESFTVKVDTLTVKPVHVLPITFTAPDITGEFEEEFVVKIADRPEPLSFKARGRIIEQASAARQ
jgi:hypothetical protein